MNCCKSRTWQILSKFEIVMSYWADFNNILSNITFTSFPFWLIFPWVTLLGDPAHNKGGRGNTCEWLAHAYLQSSIYASSTHACPLLARMEGAWVEGACAHSRSSTHMSGGHSCEAPFTRMELCARVPFAHTSGALHVCTHLPTTCMSRASHMHACPVLETRCLRP